MGNGVVLAVPNHCLCLGAGSMRDAPAVLLLPHEDSGVTIDSLQFCVPDGLKLVDTADLRLLLGLERQMRVPQRCHAGVFRDNDGGLAHLVTDHTGLPQDGSPVPEGWRFIRIVPRLKVRRHVLAALLAFFEFRLMLENRREEGSVSLDGKILASSGRYDIPAVEQVLSGLTHRFWGKKGVTFQALLDLPWHVLDPAPAGCSPSDGEISCPLDGPVTPIYGEISSGAERWAKMCGRHHVYALCPKCLGIFGRHLLAMN